MKLKLSLSLLITSFFVFNGHTVEFREIRGEFISSYQTTGVNSDSVEGHHTLAILEEHGGIQEILIPEEQSMRLLNRFSGKNVAVELYEKEGYRIPVVSNLAVLLNDTQVSYWKADGANYFEFPQERAGDELKTETIAGVVSFDANKVTSKSSGFIISGHSKVYHIGKLTKQEAYTFNGLRGKLTTFTVKIQKPSAAPIVTPPIRVPDFGFGHTFAGTLGIGHHIPMGHRVIGHSRGPYGITNNDPFGMTMRPSINVDPNFTLFDPNLLPPVTTLPVPVEPNPEEQIKDLVEVQALIVPMNKASLVGNVSRELNHGTNFLKVRLEDDSTTLLYFHKLFEDMFLAEEMSGADLSLDYRMIYTRFGLIPMVEGYEVLNENPFKNINEVGIGSLP